MAKINATALVVDDEQDIRELIEMAFASLGIDCVLSPNIKDAIRQLKKRHTDLDFCITDMRLPDGDGLNLVSHIQKNYPQLPVCVITAHGNVELAVESLKKGAFDFVNKPFDLKQLRAMAKAAMKLSNNQSDDTKEPSDKEEKTTVRLIGNSPVMKKLAAVIVKLARSQAPVFINGESGTGKELVARSIHEQSARSDGAFVPVNCGAIPENLVESEFFGYKKGAFTGANNDHDGLFVSANGGTLFLDEVADLPLSMQVKLLRAIQERAIRPIGGDVEVPVDVRILSATHKNLSQLVADNEFREDLYYRLNVISLGIPPLRNRGDDIDVLARFILNNIATANQRAYHLTEAALEKLRKYEFPGNVRELENILERAVTFCENSEITPNDIQFSNKMMEDDGNAGYDIDLTNESSSEFLFDSLTLSSVHEDDFDSHNDVLSGGWSDSASHETAQREGGLPNPNAPISIGAIDDLDEYIASVEKNVIEQALATNDYNRQATADKLGITLRTIRYKIKKHDIQT